MHYILLACLTHGLICNLQLEITHSSLESCSAQKADLIKKRKKWAYIDCLSEKEYLGKQSEDEPVTNNVPVHMQQR